MLAVVNRMRKWVGYIYFHGDAIFTTYIISLLDILPWGISMLESTGFAAHHFTQTVDDHIVQFGRSIGEK